jgi:hypothetical protein
MRRICVLLSLVALCATTLALRTPELVTADGATQAIAATTPSSTPALADHRRRPDVRLGFRSGPGLLSSALNGPFTFSPRSGQDRACRVVLLDGSDRWRSLLLGAPPLSA